MSDLFVRVARRIGVTVFALSVIAGCGGGGIPSTPPVPDASTAQNLTVTGKLVAPDGATPIANALIYVESASAPDAQRQQARAAAETGLPCGAPPNPAWPATCTAADGGFSLAVKAPGNAKLIASKGAFRSEQTLAAASSGVISMGAVALGSGGTGTPKMAVVTGDYDSIEIILAKLGYGELVQVPFSVPYLTQTVTVTQVKIGTAKFKLYRGSTSSYNSDTLPAFADLFSDTDNSGKADIFDFDIVFLNCGIDDTAFYTANNKAILRAYVEGGGRIYASDWSSDLIEQVFPQYIDFLGSDTTAPADAEGMRAAQEGTDGITTNATVDPNILAWLRGLSCEGGSCVQADDSVKIDGFLGGWAVINGAHEAAQVQTLVSANVQFSGSPVAGVRKPLTMSFSAGSGRVTYTSYHNEDTAGNSGFTPQQRILQYLVFEL